MSSAHKLLDPKNDIAFKRIFGSEKNKDILIHFLNDMLVFNGKAPIQDVTFLSPIQDPDLAIKKTSIVDVLCKDLHNNTYIVEMQVAKTKGFEKRAQYYASKAYCSQVNVGENYKNLKEVIFLAIADYIIFPEKTALKSDHVILDRETFEHDLTDFSFTFLEIGKFNKRKEDIDALSGLVEKWCYFFKYAEDVTPEELQKLVGKDGIIKKAYDELNRFYWTEDELMRYESVIKRERDYEAVLDQKYDDGLVKGEQIGIAKAEQKAEREKAERNREMAIKMLARGMDDMLISEISGLTEAELVVLKTKLTT